MYALGGTFCLLPLLCLSVNSGTDGVTTALSATVKALGSHYWLFWFCYSTVSVNCWNVASCCMSTILYMDPNKFVFWDNHQGVDPADQRYIILVTEHGIP